MVQYPINGLDVCSYAAWALYQEVTVRLRLGGWWQHHLGCDARYALGPVQGTAARNCEVPSGAHRWDSPYVAMSTPLPAAPQNYNFDVPGTSKEADMPVGHLINLLWAETTRLGCGYTKCPVLGSYVVCWYGPGFYMTPNYKRVMGKNVPRSRCQRATGDDWCEACVGKKCTACFKRPNYGQQMARYPIRYVPAYKRVGLEGCVHGPSGRAGGCVDARWQG